MDKRLKNTKNISDSNYSKTYFIKAMKNKAIVGVLITPKTSGNHPLPVGKDSKLKREMIDAATEKGIFMYFFYPQGFNWAKETVIGHTWYSNSKKGEWVRAMFPLPDIVYNRLSYRKNESQREVQDLLFKLEMNPNIYLFNSRFLNKWEVHNTLSHNSLSVDLVPETQLFNKDNLGGLLKKYPELFVKPTNNSIGKGIIKIKHRFDNCYLFQQADSETKWNRCNSTNQLYKCLKSIINNEDKYMIQKGIDLATFNGSVFDLRTEVQKDGKGKWVFTGVGVRVAARGKFVTHVPNGGSKADYNEVINRVFDYAIKEDLDRQLMNISSVIPYVLEKSLALSLGIISIDIGINKTGIMQVIEVNSKPASFDENDIRRRHLNNLNDYFLYLVNKYE